jgi:hypothetical protein
VALGDLTDEAKAKAQADAASLFGVTGQAVEGHEDALGQIEEPVG